MMIANGFDLAIMDPMDKDNMVMITIVSMIAGIDQFCMNFIKNFRAGKI